MIATRIPPPMTTRWLLSTCRHRVCGRSTRTAGATVVLSTSSAVAVVISGLQLRTAHEWVRSVLRGRPADLDPRVDPRVGDVDEEVEGQDQGRLDDDHAEDQRAVAVQHGVDEVLPEPGDVEHLLDDERPDHRD